MRRPPRSGSWARATAALAGVWAALHVAWGAHAAIGTPVPDAELPTLQGGTARVLGGGTTVLVFFRAPQDRSSSALRQLAQCRAAVASPTLRWLGVVSDAVTPASALALVREAGFDPPVLIDRGDEFYGRLGVSQHPVVVIVGRDHRLAAFEPYRSIDYCTVVTARVRHALGEISDAELQSALSPPQASPIGSEQVAARYRALARMQLGAGTLDKALDSIERSLDKAPRAAASQALRGEILAAQGRCADAVPAFREALALEPSNPAAIAGLERCRRAN